MINVHNNKICGITTRNGHVYPEEKKSHLAMRLFLYRAAVIQAELQASYTSSIYPLFSPCEASTKHHMTIKLHI
jgi:hypothetical protein